MIRYCAAFFVGTATLAVQASSLAEPAGEAVATIRTACQYEIGASTNVRYFSVSTGTTSGANKKYTAKFQLKVRGKALNGSMTFTCPVQADNPSDVAKTEETGSGMQLDVEPVLSPKALIESEDAGGRYARTVMWQRHLLSTRWSAEVAYVNSLFGDGQRSPMNYFLVCDRAVARPCIEVEMDQQVALSKSQQDGVLGFLERISPSLERPRLSKP